MNTEKKHKCWSCRKVYGKCSWSSKGIPIENWIAKPSVRAGVGKTFTVFECPEYQYDGQCVKCDRCEDITQDNKGFCEYVVYNKYGECKVNK